MIVLYPQKERNCLPMTCLEFAWHDSNLGNEKQVRKLHGHPLEKHR